MFNAYVYRLHTQNFESAVERMAHSAYPRIQCVVFCEREKGAQVIRLDADPSL